VDQLVEVVAAQSPVAGSVTRIIRTVFLDKLFGMLGIPCLLKLICGIHAMSVQTIATGRTVEVLTRTTLAVVVTGCGIVEGDTWCSGLGGRSWSRGLDITGIL
jgi:hypothetical protein